jgi:hypothetical protein
LFHAHREASAALADVLHRYPVLTQPTAKVLGRAGVPVGAS